MSSPLKGSVAKYTVDESTVSVIQALSSGHLPSAAKAIVQYADLADQVFQLIFNKIDNECSILCNRSSNSSTLFRKTNPENLETFEWKMYINELSTKAPYLLQLISTIVCHSDHRNKTIMKVNEAHYPGISMACAVLLKETGRCVVCSQYYHCFYITKNR